MSEDTYVCAECGRDVPEGPFHPKPCPCGARRVFAFAKRKRPPELVVLHLDSCSAFEQLPGYFAIGRGGGGHIAGGSLEAVRAAARLLELTIDYVFRWDPEKAAERLFYRDGPPGLRITGLQ